MKYEVGGKVYDIPGEWSDDAVKEYIINNDPNSKAAKYFQNELIFNEKTNPDYVNTNVGDDEIIPLPKNIIGDEQAIKDYLITKRPDTKAAKIYAQERQQPGFQRQPLKENTQLNPSGFLGNLASGGAGLIQGLSLLNGVGSEAINSIGDVFGAKNLGAGFDPYLSDNSSYQTGKHIGSILRNMFPVGKSLKIGGNDRMGHQYRNIVDAATQSAFSNEPQSPESLASSLGVGAAGAEVDTRIAGLNKRIPGSEEFTSELNAIGADVPRSRQTDNINRQRREQRANLDNVAEMNKKGVDKIINSIFQRTAKKLNKNLINDNELYESLTEPSYLTQIEKQELLKEAINKGYTNLFNKVSENITLNESNAKKFANEISPEIKLKNAEVISHQDKVRAIIRDKLNKIPKDKNLTGTDFRELRTVLSNQRDKLDFGTTEYNVWNDAINNLDDKIDKVIPNFRSDIGSLNKVFAINKNILQPSSSINAEQVVKNQEYTLPELYSRAVGAGHLGEEFLPLLRQGNRAFEKVGSNVEDMPPYFLNTTLWRLGQALEQPFFWLQNSPTSQKVLGGIGENDIVSNLLKQISR